MARDTYAPVKDWQDKPDKTTPILAEDLKHIETGIKEAKDNRALKELYDDTTINVGRKANTSVGGYSTAEGSQTTATAYAAHAEGYSTTVSGYYAHAEGDQTTASGSAAHAEGASNTASGTNSHAEGQKTEATYVCTHAEGYGSKASGTNSHAEGYMSKACGENCHAEGNQTTAGYEPASNSSSNNHAEGQGTLAAGVNCHAEGDHTQAGQNPGTYSAHAEGGNTIATGNYSHAEGYSTSAIAPYSHAEGNGTQAEQIATHAEGYNTKASAPYSHVEGYETSAQGMYQHVQGKYNEANGSYAHIIGGGNSDSDRKNIHTVDWNGNAYYAGDVENGAGVTMNALMDEIDKLKARLDALGNGDAGEGDDSSDVKIVSWADGTDAEIAAMAQALRDGTISVEDTGWEVGQERNVQLAAIESDTLGNHAAQIQTLVLLHKGGKMLENGNECSFVVGLKNCLADGTTLEGFGMNSSSTNTGGWDRCRMRTGCNEDFVKMLPEDLRLAFAKFQNNATDNEKTVSIDLFAFPSGKEIFGDSTTAQYADEESFQFDYFVVNKVKTAGNDGSNSVWWSRSKRAANTGGFLCISASGDEVLYAANNATVGISPYGCI